MPVADEVSYFSRFTVKFVEIVAAGMATAVSGYLIAHLGGFWSSPTPAPVVAAPSASAASVNQPTPPSHPVPATSPVASPSKRAGEPAGPSDAAEPAGLAGPARFRRRQRTAPGAGAGKHAIRQAGRADNRQWRARAQTWFARHGHCRGQTAEPAEKPRDAAESKPREPAEKPRDAAERQAA